MTASIAPWICPACGCGNAPSTATCGVCVSRAVDWWNSPLFCRDCATVAGGRCAKHASGVIFEPAWQPFRDLTPQPVYPYPWWGVIPPGDFYVTATTDHIAVTGSPSTGTVIRTTAST